MSCGLFNLPIASDRFRAVFLFGWIVSTLPPSGHGAILQATLRIRGNVIRSQDDWEFAGKRRTNPAFRISLTRENVCPLTGKLRGTHDEGYGSFWS